MSNETSLHALPPRNEEMSPEDAAHLDAYMNQMGEMQSPPVGPHYQADAPGSPAQDRMVYGPRTPGMPPASPPWMGGNVSGNTKGTSTEQWISELKMPLIVAAIVAVLGYGPIADMLSSQSAYLANPMTNLLVRALLGGLVFWLVKRFAPF